MSIIIVLASSRRNGNTAKLAEVVAAPLNATIMDLNDFNISCFDYAHDNREDDFIGVIEKLVQARRVIFATPVYWYAMSAQLKIFFDRFTDLLTINKSLGRKLRGLNIAVMATGTDTELPASFSLQFELIARYLGLELQQQLYCCCPAEFVLHEHKTSIDDFIRTIVSPTHELE
ncbi:flavodoxin family protein [Alteromonas lipolytica]|uniref:NADPH-dependent FMN reductase-like domain-containing protein n=1 Tax=Alteromonas lipolytica TaxID=1856405 RepID=A0A1E8FGU7_9ALTE|nr:flavodoxin family protein [Alteromonas lipolytica]OFI35139.1 hypothetical protein BFC17_16475 [Alteromonas lipolytica]GGF57021.1 hypothetical protein GCM10011338_06620 [Alteromonas lipolytica]